MAFSIVFQHIAFSSNNILQYELNEFDSLKYVSKHSHNIFSNSIVVDYYLNEWLHNQDIRVGDNIKTSKKYLYATLIRYLQNIKNNEDINSAMIKINKNITEYILLCDSLENINYQLECLLFIKDCFVLFNDIPEKKYVFLYIFLEYVDFLLKNHYNEIFENNHHFVALVTGILEYLPIAFLTTELHFNKTIFSNLIRSVTKQIDKYTQL